MWLHVTGAEAVAIQGDIQQALAKWESALLDIVHGAWADWLSLPNRSRLRFPRTRANIVYDLMVDRAIAAFNEEAEVRAIVKDETAKFLFGQRILVRFKKGDGNGLGSNIETQAVLAFTDPQLLIPGLPDVQKVDVVYNLNDLQTMIERVAVSARDNNIRLWSYDIEDRRGAPSSAVTAVVGTRQRREGGAPSFSPGRKGQRRKQPRLTNHADQCINAASRAAAKRIPTRRRGRPPRGRAGNVVAR